MKLLAFAAISLLAAPTFAQTGALPKCSATVTDSCDQGANNPKAMTAAQAEATGGVGDRAVHKMSAPGPAKKHHAKKHVVEKTTTTTTTTP